MLLLSTTNALIHIAAPLQKLNHQQRSKDAETAALAKQYKSQLAALERELKEKEKLEAQLGQLKRIQEKARVRGPKQQILFAFNF